MFGESAVLFATRHVTGVPDAPRCTTLTRHRLSRFRSRPHLDRARWHMTPTGSGAEGHRLQFGDDRLRVSAPLNARQRRPRISSAGSMPLPPHHGVSHAWNAFGPLLKRHCLLRVLDEPVRRLALENVRQGIAPEPRFTRAVSVGNPRKGPQAEHEDQERADACTRLLMQCIIGWTSLCRRRVPRSRTRSRARHGSRRWSLGRRPPGSRSPWWRL